MSSQDNIERLFLLEILVDNVYISSSELNIDSKTLSSLKQTCVRFQFLNYPALEICEEDFTPTKGKYDEDEVSFKSGKSCLFALRGQHPSAFSPPFNMNVTVSRVMANNKLCTIGKTCIKLGECFATIVNCCIVCPASPTSKTIKDTYSLVDDRNCQVGKITVFIRLSCFGKLIVTQFQLGGLENKSFLFRAESEIIQKDDESQKPKIIVPTQYKESGGLATISKPETFCVKAGSQEASERPCRASASPKMHSPYPYSPFMSMGMPLMMPPTGMGGMLPPSGVSSMMPMPNFGSMMPTLQRGQTMQLMPLTNLHGGGESPEMKMAPTDNYKELTASVNGHELCIKILRKPKRPKELKVLESSDSSITMNNKERAQQKLMEAFCDCDVPIPQELREIRCKRPKKKTEESPCPLLSGAANVSRELKIPKPKGTTTLMSNDNTSITKSDKDFPQQKPNDIKNVNVKENYMLRLGNCPPVCYKIGPPQPDPSTPCVTERDAQFEQQDMEIAAKLHEDYLKNKDKGQESDKSSAKGKGKRGKAKGKGKGKGKKGKGKGKKK